MRQNNFTTKKLKSSNYYQKAEKKYQIKKLLSKYDLDNHIIYHNEIINILKCLEEKNQNINFPCWINIHSKVFKKIVPGKEKRVTQITDHRRPLYLIVTEVLQKIGIIKIDQSYCPNHYTKSYKFTSKYLPARKVSTHKITTKTLQIQKYLNRRLYRELYTVCPQPSELRSSGLPSTDLKELAEEEETTPTLEEALKICQRLSTQTLSEYGENQPDDLPKPVDLVSRHQQRPSVSARLESSVAVPDIAKKKIGIVLDKDFRDKGRLRETIYNLKSQAEMIIGIDNRRFSENIRKMSDEFEIPHGEVLSDHYQWTTRSLRPMKEHNRKYFTFCWRKRDKIFAEKVDRVIIFKDRNKKLNKNTFYLIQELDRQGVTFEIREM